MKNFDKLKGNLKIAFEKAKVTCKNIFKRYRESRPHHGVRAIAALAVSLYLLYLLKCFLTIPVKDYYINVTAYTPDSIVPEIDFTIGNKNVLNTYSSDYIIEPDSCAINCHLYERKYKLEDQDLVTVLTSTLDGFRIDVLYNTCVLKDSIKYDSAAFSAMKMCYDQYKNQIPDGKTISSAQNSSIYAHIYYNIISAYPIGVPELNNIYLSDKLVFDNKNQYGIGFTSPELSSADSVIYQSDCYLNRLSPNHVYYGVGYLYSIPTILRMASDTIKQEKDNVEISGSLGSTSIKVQFGGIYKVYPKLQQLLSKEDISQAYYRFSVKSGMIESYIINLHSRGGAIIENNPSDELRVLNLYDTQIIKKRKNQVKTIDYEESDLFITFPENSAIQYIRLFVVTLLIGWLILSFCRNIHKLICKRRNYKVFNIKP